MALYNPPDGYLYDSNSGLYYSQVVAQDEMGNISQIVTWFDANTGQYSQNVYPVKGSAISSSTTYTNGDAKRTSTPGGTSNRAYSESSRKNGERYERGKTQRKNVSENVKRQGKELGTRTKVYADRVRKSIRKEASNIDSIIKSNARTNAKHAGLAYTYINANLTPDEPNFMWNIFFKVKEYMNNSPLWLKIVVCLIIAVLDIIRITIVGFDNESSAPVFMILAFVAIPFGVMDFIDLKRKYGVTLKQLQPSFVLVICGSFMIAPAFYGNAVFVRTFKKIWAMSGPAPIIIWYVMAVAAFAIMTLAMSRKFRKYNVPKVELMMTVTVMTLLSFFVGILTLWAILIVVMIAIVLFFVPMLFQAGMSSGQSYTATHKEEYVEGYDYFGNKVYDSRYDDPL